MKPKTEQQQQAQNLYLHTSKTQTEIADILDVNSKTLYLWIRNGKWEEMKRAARQAPGQLVVHFFNQMEAINERVSSRDDQCPTPQEVSMLARLLKMTQTISANHAGYYIQAFEELLRFVTDPVLQRKIVEQADRFVKGNFGDDDFHHKRHVTENLQRIEKNLQTLEKESGNDQAMPGRHPAQSGNDRAMQGNEANPPESNIHNTHEELDNASTHSTSPGSAEIPKNRAMPQIPVNDDPVIEEDKWARERNIRQELLVQMEQWEQEQKRLADERNEYEVISQTVNRPVDQQPTKIIELSAPTPLLRPSPFRDGNTIWINHIDDLNDDDRKMGDIIRFYPPIE